MTRRGLWVARVVFTIVYLSVAAGWYWWLDSMAPDTSVWQDVGLFMASGVVWFLAGEVRAVWRAKPKPRSRSLAPRETEAEYAEQVLVELVRHARVLIDERASFGEHEQAVEAVRRLLAGTALIGVLEADQ